MNQLEQLLSEWYEYKGYFIRKNVRVQPRKKGGYDGELDIVGFDPIKGHLIHVEPSCDTYSWAKREERYSKKFKAGREHIHGLFEGFKLPATIDQRAVFLYGSKTRGTIGGGRIYLVSDVLNEIKNEFMSMKIEKGIVPETFPLLRTLHIFIDQYDKLTK